MDNGAASPLNAVGPQIPTEHTCKWPVVSLTEALAQNYASEGRHRDWANERDELVARLHSLEDELGNRYQSPTVLGVGGSGVVLRLIDTQLANEPTALKFPRPVAGKSGLMSEMMDK